jgi:hypothetical protein
LKDAEDLDFEPSNYEYYEFENAYVNYLSRFKERKVPSVKINVTTIPLFHEIMIPPQAPKPNTTISLDTGDSRVLDAAMYKSKIWFTSADACKPATDNQTRSCFAVVQIDVQNNRIIQDFDLGIPGKYTYDPALTVGANGNLDIIYGVVSDKVYPSLSLSGQTMISILSNTKY